MDHHCHFPSLVLPVSYFLSFHISPLLSRRSEWRVCVSSLQSNGEAKPPPRQCRLTLSRIGWKRIWKHGGKRKQLERHKRMALQMGTNLGGVSLMFLHTLTSTAPITLHPPPPPIVSQSFFPSQVVLLFVMFRGRHQKHLRNGGYCVLKGNIVWQKNVAVCFPARNTDPALQRRPRKLPMKRLWLSTSEGDKWGFPTPQVFQHSCY